ncbi:MAG: ribosome assembly RNA-binding protein YhbY [Gammaproteobacteria bacterium]|nr:ribosome assembly RNA-binding protein YhbY [Gammaproteobacteria bacterium]|tara:strand:- start:290 stop:595 length:306 start_codon:yes stop_codon:yes gene_type:complete
MDKKFLKKLISIGHKLSPLLRISKNGLSESILNELNRALNDHELIKIKIVAAKEERSQISLVIEKLPETIIVQSIGGVLLVYRPSNQSNQKLSNIYRSEKQ